MPGPKPHGVKLHSRLLEIYNRLFGCYGPQGWWPSNGPMETIIGAILTQNTAWSNASKALGNLREAGAMNMSSIRTLSLDELAELIRPSGYFNEKAKKLQAIAAYLDGYGDDIGTWGTRDPKELREELLRVYGIGPETADDIVLYVAKLPSFVIDTYTRRIVDRIGLTPAGSSYDSYQAFFENNLPNNPDLFNEYHALLDAHAKFACTKSNPLCHNCVLADICKYGYSSEPRTS